MPAYRTVTGPILDIVGTVNENSILRFTPHSAVTSDGAVFSDTPVSVTPDASGDFSIDVLVNDSVPYSVDLIESVSWGEVVYQIGTIVVAAGASVTLQELLDDYSPPAEPVPTVTQLVAAVASATSAQTGAETAQAGAEAAQTAAESAQASAEAAQAGAVTARAAAETAQAGAETAQTAAEAGQSGAETAQTAAETAQAGSESAETSALAAQSGAEAAQTSAETAQAAAEAAQAGSEAAQTAAEAAQAIAETASTSAETARTGAEAAETGAEAAKASAEAAEAAVVAVYKFASDYGATGDGATDDTTALQAAATAGGTTRFAAGTYLVDAPITFSQAGTHWILQKGATIKLRTAPTSDAAMIEISGTADYSSIGGPGILDGNRGGLSYPGTSPIVRGIRCAAATNIRYYGGLTIQGFWHHTIYHGSGDDPIMEDITMKDCGRAFAVQSCANPTVRNISIDDCGNDGISMYQHCTAIRDFTGGHFENIRVLNWHPDGSGLEPNPTAINFERASGFTVAGVYVSGFSGSSPSGRYKGVKFDGCFDFNSEISAVVGYNEGILIKGCRDYVLKYGSLDGKFVDTTDGDGLAFENGGLYDNFFSGAIEQNSRSIAISENGTIIGGSITGFFNGVTGASKKHRFFGVDSYGNIRNGWRLTSQDLAADFDPSNTGTVIFGQVSQEVELHGCSGRYNGRAGMEINAADGVTVYGGDWRNNGQDTTEATNKRAAFTLNGTASQRGAFRVFGADCRDDQTWSVANLASFKPATTDASNQITLALTDPQYGEVGQYIRLKNATGSDEVGRIVDKRMDDIWVEFPTAKTFVETSNLNALTGTVSGLLGSTTVTGVGTSFDTEVKGHVYLRLGAEYHRVSVVNGAEEMTLNTPLVGAHSDETGYLVQIDVEAIQSQQYAIFADSDTDGPVEFNDIRQSGNVTAPNEIKGVGYGDVSTSAFNASAVSQGGLQVWNDVSLTSFTPDVSDAETGGNSASVGTTRASYVNIGPLTIVTYELLAIDTTGMTGGNDLWISLPFATASGGINKFMGSASVSQCSFSGAAMPYIQNGKSAFRMASAMASGAQDYLTVGELTSGSGNVTATVSYIRNI